MVQQEQQQQQQDSAGRTDLQAVLLNRANDVDRLLAQGAPLRDGKWPGNFTALHAAAFSNCWRALPALLSAAARQGISVDSRLELQPNDGAYARFFCNLGFPYQSSLESSGIMRKDKAAAKGVTPLHLACYEGSLDIIPILLAHGASASCKCDMPILDSSEDALAHLLYGKGSEDAARLVQTVKLLLKHGVKSLAWVKRRLSLGCNRHYIADESLPLDVRCCLMNFVLEFKLQTELKEARILLRMYGAALCGDGAAMLHNLYQFIQDECRWLTTITTTSALGTISLVDVLEAAPPALAARAVQALPEEKILGGTWLLLREAVSGLKPKAVHALLSIVSPRTHEGEVVLMDHLFGLTPFGPCPVLFFIARLSRGYHASSSGEEAKALAVMVHLIEAGFKPSIYPEARYTYHRDQTIHRKYDALAEHPELLQKMPRRVLTALQRPTWSQANHRDFPPAFRATVRAFLLAEAASARHRQQQQQDAQEQQQQGPDSPALAGTVQQAGHLLGDLPVPLLERVLGLAAYPLSAWL